LFDVQDAGSSPIAPLAVAFYLNENFRQKVLVFEVVFYEQYS
jgi:hypothetical protein